MYPIVFLDGGNRQRSLEEVVRNCGNGITLIDCSDAAGGFIKAWHERYDGRRDNDSSVQVHRKELDNPKDYLLCYVTEKKTSKDADVVYASTVAKISTLTFASSEPLSQLHFSVKSDEEEEAAVRRLLCVDAETQNARVIVIEGGDGAGKATQTKLLVDAFHAMGREVHTLDFPNDGALCGGIIRGVLSGNKGTIDEVSPEMFSFLFATNRVGVKRVLWYWLHRGCIVVLDRYYTANFGHQASKKKPEEWHGFIETLQAIEVDFLDLPPANEVVYLDLPPASALHAMTHDQTRKSLDIHETAGGSYKDNVRRVYNWCCAHLAGWHRIECCTDEARKARDEVHREILQSLGFEEPQGHTMVRTPQEVLPNS